MTRGKYAQPTQAERAAERDERKAGAADRLKAVSGTGILERQAKAAGYALVPLADVAGSEVEEEEGLSPYSDMTNAELSAELKDRGLATTGNKDELIARLEESDATDA